MILMRRSGGLREHDGKSGGKDEEVEDKLEETEFQTR